jgi:hypothetical protein
VNCDAKCAMQVMIDGALIDGGSLPCRLPRGHSGNHETMLNGVRYAFNDSMTPEALAKWRAEGR